MNQGRPRVPPVTAPQQSSEVMLGSASGRPQEPPATDPRKPLKSRPFVARPTDPPASAPVRAESRSVAPSEQLGEISIIQGLQILGALLTERVPLEDYHKAAGIYTKRRHASMRYSTLPQDASEADYREECHQSALSVAIRSVTEPQQYSTDAPPPSSPFPPGYYFELRAAPPLTIKQPTPPARFARRASSAELEDQLGFEISWRNAFSSNNLPELQRLVVAFQNLYASYQPEGFQSQAVPASVSAAVSCQTPSVPRVLAVFTACATGSFEPPLPPSVHTIPWSSRQIRAASDSSDSSSVNSLPLCLDSRLQDAVPSAGLPVAGRSVAACPSPSGMGSQRSSFSGSVDGLTPFRKCLPMADYAPAASRVGAPG